MLASSVECQLPIIRTFAALPIKAAIPRAISKAERMTATSDGTDVRTDFDPECTALSKLRLTGRLLGSIRHRPTAIGEDLTGMY
jgi:hypothetical protein